MFFVYVLYSDRAGRYYTGQTHDVMERLLQHNRGLSKSTCHGVPWRVLHSEPFQTRAEAMKREKFLKSGAGREELKRLLLSIDGPEI